jgi:hypothetical protein
MSTGTTPKDDEHQRQRNIRRNVLTIILIAAIQAALTSLGALLFDILGNLNQ